MDNPPKCPECGRTLLRNGVMLYGNVLTDEPQRPVARRDCPDCLVLVAGDIDEEEGWRQWEAQGNKRLDTLANAAPLRGGNTRPSSPLNCATSRRGFSASPAPRTTG